MQMYIHASLGLKTRNANAKSDNLSPMGFGRDCKVEDEMSNFRLETESSLHLAKKWFK